MLFAREIVETRDDVGGGTALAAVEVSVTRWPLVARHLLRGRSNLVLLHGHNHRPYTHLVHGTATPLYCAGSLSKHGAESFWLFDLFGDTLNARRGIWKNARFALLD